MGIFASKPPMWLAAVTEPFIPLRLNVNWDGPLPNGKLTLTVSDATGEAKLVLRGGGDTKTWSSGACGETQFHASRATTTTRNYTTPVTTFLAARHIIRTGRKQKKQWSISSTVGDARALHYTRSARAGCGDTAAEYTRHDGSDDSLPARLSLRNCGDAVYVWKCALPTDSVNGEAAAMSKAQNDCVASISLTSSQEDVCSGLNYVMRVSPQYAGPASTLSQDELALFLALATEFFWSRGINCIDVRHEGMMYI